MRTILANVYMRGGKSILVSSGPGRSVPFRGGFANIVDKRDFPTILSRDDVIVEFPADQLDWVRGYIKMSGEDFTPKAELRLPPGYIFGEDYAVREMPKEKEKTPKVPARKDGWGPINLE